MEVCGPLLLCTAVATSPGSGEAWTNRQGVERGERQSARHARTARSGPGRTGTPPARKRAVVSGASAVKATAGLLVAWLAATMAVASSGRSRPTSMATAPAIAG